MENMYDLADKYKDLILEAERYIWNHPEPGYKEFETNKYMSEAFEKLGYTLTYAEGVTGFYTTIDTGRAGPTVLVLAELDSLINFSHPECNKETGAVHSCGHHVQCATMLGLAAALTEKEYLEELCGKIKLCVVPAEEGIEIAYRQGLIEKGVIEFIAGKAEFLSRRYFDDVDIAFMMHAWVPEEGLENMKFLLTKGSNGNIKKRITFKGKAAHAGSKPFNGINALYAANLGMLAVNSLRETFREKDYVRVHSIITKGGDAVNAIPDEVVLESYVRASNVHAIIRTNEAVNRTLSASAAAIGAGILIEDKMGCEPLITDKNLSEVALGVFEEIAGKDNCLFNGEWKASSTDMGDISSLYPVIHFYAAGCEGTMHGKDFRVTDPYSACVLPVKAELGILRELLSNGAEKAKKIISEYTPVFATVDEYLAHKRAVTMKKDAVRYNEDGTVTLDYKN